MTWNEKSKRWFKKYKKRQYVVSCKELVVPATKEGSVKAANGWWVWKKMRLDTKRQPVVRRYQADWEQIIALCRAKAEWLSKHTGSTKFLRECGEGMFRRIVAAISEMPKRQRLEFAARAEKRIERLRRSVSEITDNRAEESMEFLKTAEFWQQQIDHGGTLLDPKPFIGQFPEIYGLDDEWRQKLAYTTIEAPAHINTIRGQAERWLEMQAARTKTETICKDRFSAYSNAINAFWVWAGADKSLEAVTGELLESYKIYLLSQVAEHAKDSAAGMTKAYAQDHIDVAIQFVNWLCRQDLVQRPTILSDRNALRIQVKHRTKEQT
jgi:hypothetical protein